MPITFQCPSCGRQLEAPEEALGMAGTCRFCGARVTAPGGPGVPPQPAPPASTFGATESGVWPISQPTGRVDAGRILSETWTYLKQYWATLLAAQLIVNVLFMVAVMPFMFASMFLMQGSLMAANNPPFGLPTPAWPFAALVLVELLAYPMVAGPLYVADRIIATGDTSIGAVFGWRRHYGALLAYFVLMALPSGAVALPLFIAAPHLVNREYLILPLVLLSCVVSGFVLVSLGMGVMEIVDRGVDAITALKASWEFTKGHRWAILGTGALLYLVSMAGMFACYIGMFFTMNALPLGAVLIYRHLRGLEGAPDA